MKNALKAYRSGFCLPAALYGGEEAYEADMKHIFCGQWIFIASLPEIPRPGNFITVEIGKSSIIVVRVSEDEVKAFYNVCRHRGALLCTEEKGACAKFVCQYHHWIYGLDGELIRAKDPGEGFDPAQYPLAPVACENVEGMIYVCLSDEPDDSIQRFRRDLTPYLEFYRLDKLKVAHQFDLVEEGNWKHVMENNRECHHCGHAHPELTTSLPSSGFGRGLPENEGEAAPDCDFETYFEAERERWREAKMPSDLIEFPDNDWWRVVRLPLKEGTHTHCHVNGELGCKKLLHAFEQPEGGGLSLWTHPNGWNHFLCDQVMTFRVLPLASGRSIFRTTWLVHEDAEEGEDYEVEHLTHTWVQTNLQDKRLVEMAFKGSQSRGYQPGPYSPVAEGMVQQFLDWWHAKMSECVE